MGSSIVGSVLGFQLILQGNEMFTKGEQIKLKSKEKVN